MSLLLPQEIWRALRIYAFQKEVKQAAVIRELLERHLEAKGCLKVLLKKDAEGREVRFYEVAER